MKIGEVRYEYTCIKWKPPSKWEYCKNGHSIL